MGENREKKTINSTAFNVTNGEVALSVTATYKAEQDKVQISTLSEGVDRSNEARIDSCPLHLLIMVIQKKTRYSRK